MTTKRPSRSVSFHPKPVSRNRSGAIIRLTLGIFTALLSFAEVAATAGPYILVNGPSKVVKFDLATGEASLYADFGSPDSFLRNIVVREDGEVFVSTFGRNQNVVRLVEQAGVDYLVPEDFTPSIGGFGPAQMAFHNGDLYAAGDRSRAVIRYDGVTGAEIERIAAPSTGNIRGMTIGGDHLYYAEIFQDRISRFDLTTSPPSGGNFFQSFAYLDEPYSLEIGHTGNLFVGSRANTGIQEFDIESGEFIGTFVNLLDFDPTITQTGTYFTYSRELDSYFATSAGGKVYQFDSEGTLLQTLQSELLAGSARGIAVVPEAKSLCLLLATVITGVCWSTWKKPNALRA